uniref:Uncharacterized protein n=1 Tax=uncultured prokaryote TaxID=198431 RepID=A0A0H5QLU0_9ZZZZ|nr:hypothetical protein [uncultured prokaryote]
MPYGQPHFLFTAFGTMPGGDIWTTGFRTNNTGGNGGLEVLNELTPAVRIAWATAWARSRFGPSPQTTFNGVTGRIIGTSGKTDVVAESLQDPPVLGNTNDTLLPNQCALVVTLQTGQAGRTHRGRMYIPCTGNAISSDGRLPQSVAQSTADGLKNVIEATNDALAAALPTRFRVAVQSSVPPFDQAEVTSVRVGDVVDTQRRRRSSLRENYVEARVAA